MVCAALHAAEKTIKIDMEKRYSGFRPNMSLSFANMTITAVKALLEMADPRQLESPGEWFATYQHNQASSLILASLNC